MFEEYTRKPFDVQAVQVSLENSEEVATWCRGRIELIDYKLMGVKTKLPCVKLPVQGPKKTQEPPALLGHWVVLMNGLFRVYRPAPFEAAFEKKTTSPLPWDPKSSSEAIKKYADKLNGTLFNEDEYVNYANSNSGPFHPIPAPSGMALHHTVGEALEAAAKRVDEKFGSSQLSKDTQVRVINKASDQYSWSGVVVEDQGGDLYRIHFDNSDTEMSYMRHELEEFVRADV